MTYWCIAPRRNLAKIMRYDVYLQSVDKKIPALGYTKANVWIISKRANSIKNDASIEELSLLVRNLKEHL